MDCAATPLIRKKVDEHGSETISHRGILLLKLAHCSRATRRAANYTFKTSAQVYLTTGGRRANRPTIGLARLTNDFVISMTCKLGTLLLTMMTTNTTK